MTASAIISPKFYVFDDDTGKPLAFGKVHTYKTGTSTPKPTFTSEDATTENTNPVILNDAGYADIYLDGRYKIVVTDANDVEVWTADPVTQGGDALRRANTLPGIQALDGNDATSVQMLGRQVIGDGAGGTFLWDGSFLETEVGNDEITSNEGDGGIYIAPASDKTGASGAWVRQYNTGFIHASWYGQLADGVTDDAAAINLAISRASTLGGGTVFLREGTTLVKRSSGAEAIIAKDNVHLKGPGREASVITQPSGENAHIISINPATDFTISDLTIDGNRSNQTLGVHGIRAGEATRFVAYNLNIRECFRYGIGLQGDGLHKDCTIRDLYIENIGFDGIDCKNKTDNDSGNVFHNITVRNHGLSGSGDQAGIDVRGEGTVISDCHVLNYGTGNGDTGIRIRSGESGDNNGLGAVRSIISNCFVKPNDTINSFGYKIEHRQCLISNCHAVLCDTGFRVRQQESELNNCIATNCKSVGFTIEEGANPFPADADRCLLSACTARSGNDTGFYCGNVTEVSCVNCHARSNDGTGFLVDTNAVGTQLMGGISKANTTDLINNGVDTNINNMKGVKTKTNVQSGGIPIDSAGTKTASVPHGLDVTPSKRDVTLTLVTASDNEFQVDNLRVLGADATNIDIVMVVGKAAPTSGDTAKVGIVVDASQR